MVITKTFCDRCGKELSKEDHKIYTKSRLRVHDVCRLCKAKLTDIYGPAYFDKRWIPGYYSMMRKRRETADNKETSKWLYELALGRKNKDTNQVENALINLRECGIEYEDAMVYTDIDPEIEEYINNKYYKEKLDD